MKNLKSYDLLYIASFCFDIRESVFAKSRVTDSPVRWDPNPTLLNLVCLNLVYKDKELSIELNSIFKNLLKIVY
jgi:hypothetical protein